MRLQLGIQKYLDEKWASGLSFSKGREGLLSFCRHIGNIPMNQLHINQTQMPLRTRASDRR